MLATAGTAEIKREMRKEICTFLRFCYIGIAHMCMFFALSTDAHNYIWNIAHACLRYLLPLIRTSPLCLNCDVCINNGIRVTEPL